MNLTIGLKDTHHIDKKGKVITILMQACKEITRLTNYKYRRMKTDISYEVTPESEFPIVEIIEDENVNVEDKEIDVKSFIESLRLNETHLAILSGRLNGISFPQIAKVIQRAASTAYDKLQTIQRRFTAIYGYHKTTIKLKKEKT